MLDCNIGHGRTLHKCNDDTAVHIQGGKPNGFSSAVEPSRYLLDCVSPVVDCKSLSTLQHSIDKNMISPLGRLLVTGSYSITLRSC